MEMQWVKIQKVASPPPSTSPKAGHMFGVKAGAEQNQTWTVRDQMELPDHLLQSFHCTEGETGPRDGKRLFKVTQESGAPVLLTLNGCSFLFTRGFQGPASDNDKCGKWPNLDNGVGGDPRELESECSG